MNAKRRPTSKYCHGPRRLPMHRDWGALRLDRRSRIRLDALGKHRGLTWRQMPGGNDTARAITFWLWRHDLIANFKNESAAADALRDIEAEEAATQA